MRTEQSKYPPIEERFSSSAGLPPGTLVHVGKRFDKEVKVTVIDYNLEHAEHKELSSASECSDYMKRDSVTWINVDGLHNTDIISEIGDIFNIHPLVLEDIVNTRQRPKLEEFGDQVFISLKMLGVQEDRKSMVMEQVSLVMGKGWVISFQEQKGDVFDSLRNRIMQNQGLTRKNGSDFLLYRLLDLIVDNYFFVAEFFGETLEELEEDVLENPDTKNLHRIQSIKKLMIQFKRNTSPLREVVNMLDKDEHPLILKTTKRYLRDLYEHVIQVTEAIDTQRDILGGIMDLHSSGVSNKMNQVMQVLTIIATIFIPLTFIAGIYGMNFEKMPELKWDYGYAYVWALMVALFIVMMVYFRRKRWL